MDSWHPQTQRGASEKVSRPRLHQHQCRRAVARGLVLPVAQSSRCACFGCDLDRRVEAHARIQYVKPFFLHRYSYSKNSRFLSMTCVPSEIFPLSKRVLQFIFRSSDLLLICASQFPQQPPFLRMGILRRLRKQKTGNISIWGSCEYGVIRKHESWSYDDLRK